MISIRADQVTQVILSLFDFTRPTMPRAFNVLEGITRGKILVDDLTHPTWAVVHEVTYGTVYIGGQADAALIDSLVQHFRQTGDVGLGCWLDDPLNGMLPTHPDYDGRTLNFIERSSIMNDGHNPLPDGYIAAIRDQSLLKQSFDYESTLASFGTEEEILKHTLGVDIVLDDRVVSEAATGPSTHGWIEIGIVTAESHRQRGLATFACSRLIDICEAQGYRTWWDCAKQNIASTKLARKLGYRNEREYRYIWWARNKTSNAKRP